VFRLKLWSQRTSSCSSSISMSSTISIAIASLSSVIVPLITFSNSLWAYQSLFFGFFGVELSHSCRAPWRCPNLANTPPSVTTCGEASHAFYTTSRKQFSLNHFACKQCDPDLPCDISARYSISNNIGLWFDSAYRKCCSVASGCITDQGLVATTLSNLPLSNATTFSKCTGHPSIDPPVHSRLSILESLHVSTRSRVPAMAPSFPFENIISFESLMTTNGRSCWSFSSLNFFHVLYLSCHHG
jgi:hypothetical protein